MSVKNALEGFRYKGPTSIPEQKWSTEEREFIKLQGYLGSSLAAFVAGAIDGQPEELWPEICDQVSLNNLTSRSYFSEDKSLDDD